jgi:predicted signal transduction protein with EAL and GGDEF domain
VGLASAPAAADAGVALDLPELLASADRALYRAKRDGRNRVHAAEPRPEARGLSQPPAYTAPFSSR